MEFWPFTMVYQRPFAVSLLIQPLDLEYTKLVASDMFNCLCIECNYAAEKN